MADGPAVDHEVSAHSQGSSTGAAEKVGKFVGRIRGGHKAQQQSEYKTDVFKRNFFLTDEGSTQEGVSNPNRDLWRNKEKKAAPHEWVQFSDESRGELSRFLNDHLKNIQDLRKKSGFIPDEDLELLKLFVGDGAKPELDETALTDSITDKLNDPRGWVLGMERYRDVQMLKRLALGARTFTEIESNHVYGIGKGTDLTMEQVDREGFVHKFGREKVMPNWEDIRDFVAKPGVVLAGTAATWALANPALAALWPAGAFAHSALDSGQKIRDALKPYSDAFKVVVADKKMAQYVKDITGGRIDPSDYKVNPTTGTLELDPDKPYYTSINVESVVNDVKKGQEALNRFNRELGIKDFHASPEEFIFRIATGKSAYVEPAPTRYAKRIQDIMDTDPKFKIKDRDEVEGNLKKYMGARRKVMMEMIEDYAETIVKEEADPKSSKVNEKIAAREKDGRVAKKKAEELVKSKERLAEDKTKILDVKTELTSYEAALEPLKTDREAIKTILTDVLRGAFASPEDALVALEKLTNDATSKDSVIINGRPQRPIAASLHENDGWLEGELSKIDAGGGPWAKRPGEKDTAYQERMAGAYTAKSTEHKRREDRIVSELDVIDGVVEKIKAAQQKITKSKEELSESNQQVIKMAEVTKRMEDNHTKIIKWAIAGVDDNALRTLSPDELLEKLNKANSKNKAVGWKSEDNESRRQELLDAIVEAQALNQESLDPKVADRKTNGYNALHGNAAGQYGLSDHMLMTSSVAEIRQHIDDVRAARPTAYNVLVDSSIANAIAEAKNRLRVRVQAFGAVDKVFDKKTEELQGKIEKIPEAFKDELDHLRTVSTLIERRRTGISDKVFGITASPKELAKYTSVDAIPKIGGEYTAAEVKAAAPAGYYEILDLMFDYKNGFKYKITNKDGAEEEVHETREDYFQRIQKLLPPKELAQLMTKSLSGGKNTTDDINKALQYISSRLGKRQDTFRDLRRAFRDTIDTLYKQTGSID
ncbi:MAG TPA: hypothetical protein VM077_04865 [Candidatus Limnocylindrales bacterium]|nr:hypothetical protein [Candidatus Limnocylindrales bacterium]